MGSSLQRHYRPVEGVKGTKDTIAPLFTGLDRQLVLGAVYNALAMLAKLVAIEKMGAERCIAMLIPVEGLHRAHRGGFIDKRTSTACLFALSVLIGFLADVSSPSYGSDSLGSSLTGWIALWSSIAATGISMQQVRSSSNECSFLAGAMLVCAASICYVSDFLQFKGQLITQTIAVLAGIAACSWSATQPRAISTALRISWPLIMTLTGFISLNLLHSMTISQAASFVILFIALYRSIQTSGVASSAQSAANVHSANFVATKFGGYYINEILREKESRDIFYFLLLNLSFMVVQMLYGIWTNSLGLISDSIHMFFDCLALAVGLVAAVMSKWPASRSHPFGFAKVEIISGFANGIFLVLISFSIMIEAIERLLEPPEMTTDQLLLISTLGLGVNLVGIFAFNHGHHHGHSHGHSHSHDHSEEKKSPAPLPTIHTPRTDRNDGSFDHAMGLRSPMPDFSNFSAFDSSPISLGVKKSSTDLLEVANNSLAAPVRGRSSGRSKSPVRRSGSPLKFALDSPLADVAELTESSPGRKENAPFLQANGHHHDHADNHNHNHKNEHGHKHDDEHKHDHEHDHDHNHNQTHRDSLKMNHNAELHTRTASYDLRSGHDHAHQSCTGHQAGHSHNRKLLKNNHSLSLISLDGHDHSHNMEGIFLHILADTLGSAGVIVSTLLIRFSGWTGFDPLASIFIAVLIFLSVIPLLKSSFGDLLLTLQNDQEYTLREVLGEVSLISGVGGIPFIRFWIDGEQRMHGILTIRAGIDGDTEVVRQKVKRKLHEGVPELVDVVVQVDRVE